MLSTPTARSGIPPAALLAEGRDEVTGYGVELVNDQVLGIEPGFMVRAAGGRTVTARRILMATGVGGELPDVAGVRQRWGKDLQHCPYCHGWEVRDQPLGVLGALPGSAQHALLVRQWSGDVVFFVRTYDLMPAEQRQLEVRRIRVVSGEVARLVVQDDRLTGVELADGRVVARTAVFLRPGNLPHDACEWHRADQRCKRRARASGWTTSRGRCWTRGGLRPHQDPFDLIGSEGIGTFRRFIERAADLVVSYGGSFSGEHGDGQSRGELLGKMFGDDLVRAFGQVKAIFDPDNLMNPGKVVAPYRLDENLRLGVGWAPRDYESHFSYPDDDGRFERAVMRCVGVGKCRHSQGGVMCPSYMVTREEEHSTRGRSRLRPRAHYSMGWLPVVARAASRALRLVNALTQAPILRDVLATAGGIDRRRRIPLFAGQTLQAWAARHDPGTSGLRGEVVLWPDTFTNHLAPSIGQAAVEVPILVRELPATLILASWVFRSRLGQREWACVIVMVAALASMR